MNTTMERGREDLGGHSAVGYRAGKAAGGLSLIETIDCLAVIILAILGLSGVLTMEMMGVAIIAFGASLVLQGGTVKARAYRTGAAAGGEADFAHARGIVAIEFLIGVTGIVLGILALAGVAPAVLPPLCTFLFGSVLLVCGAAAGQPRGAESETAFLSIGPSAVIGLEIVAGFTAIILGILGLTGVYPVTLTLVALLVMSISIMLENLATSQRWLKLPG